MFNWTWPGAGRLRGTHCGRRWYLYPPLPSMTLSSQHKARLIGWASLCLPGPPPNAGHQTLFDALTFSLSFSRLYAASLCSPVCVAPSRNTSPAAHPCPHPKQFLAYQMTPGLKASCQTWYETWLLLGDLSPRRTPCCTQGPSSLFWKYFSLSWSYCIRFRLLTKQLEQLCHNWYEIVFSGKFILIINEVCGCMMVISHFSTIVELTRQFLCNSTQLCPQTLPLFWFTNDYIQLCSVMLSLHLYSGNFFCQANPCPRSCLSL